MKKMAAGRDKAGVSRIGRRPFLAGVGATGLAAATAIFGSAVPASALVAAGCCRLYCKSSKDLYLCEMETYYAWTCTVTGTGGKPVASCTCCEHGSPGTAGCSSINYSTADCVNY